MVALYQGLLRVWLEQLMKYHSIYFESMPLTIQLFHPKHFHPKWPDADLFENGGCFAAFDNYQQTFTYNAAQILGAHSGRLRLCGECNDVFLADRRQQVFCSGRCLNRVTQRRWRAERKEEGTVTAKPKIRREKSKGEPPWQEKRER